MVQRFSALLALWLALARKEEACEGDEGASLLQLQKPKQQAQPAGPSSLESRKFLEEWRFRCRSSTPPTFYASLDGARLSEADLPVNVSAGSELVILGCNLEVGALGAGPMVNALGEGARLSVSFRGSFNKRVVGEDYAPFGPLPEATALSAASELARAEERLAGAEGRWAARDGCPEQAPDTPFPVPASLAAVARSDDDGEGHGSLRKAQKEAKVVGPQFLFPPVLVGPVGSGARVEISVRQSANVEVRGGSLTVSGGGSSLMGPMVRAEGTLEDVVMRIAVQESARVEAERELLVYDGYLIARVLRADGYSRSDVSVTLEKVANAYARNVTIVAADSGTALTATVFAGDDAGVNASDARLSLKDTANVRARNLRFVGEPGLDAVVMNEIMAFPAPGLDSRVSANLRETGNVRLRGSILGRGHLFDEVMDLGDFEGCRVEAYLTESGNAYAASRVSEGAPPWIDDVVQLDVANQTVVKVRMEGSFNQRVRLLELAQAISGVAFLEEVVAVLFDGALLEGAHFDVGVDDCLNWYGEVLDMRQSGIELLDRAIGINGDLAKGSSVNVFVSKTANAFGDAVCLADELVNDAAVLRRVTDSSVYVRVVDSANVEATTFFLAQQELMRSALDVNELVWDSKISVKLERSSNVKAATVNITNGGELLEQAVETENLQGAETSVSVYVSKSANVAAQSLNMVSNAYLMDHGASLEFRNRLGNVSVDLTFIGSGSAWAKQANLSQQSRLVKEVLEIGDATRDLPDVRLYVKGCGNLAVQRASRLRGASFLIEDFVERPGNASTLAKLEVLFSGVAKGPVSFSNNSENCFDGFAVHPSSCRGPQ